MREVTRKKDIKETREEIVRQTGQEWKDRTQDELDPNMKKLETAEVIIRAA